MKQKTEYKTETMKLAAYLSMRGYVYSIFPRGNEKIVDFVFDDHDGHIKDKVAEYWTGMVTVNLPSYNSTIDRMRDRVKALLGGGR